MRAKRVKQARLAARHRAARTIQSRWRDYIREKRRYEATCARLKARLQQEQVAASLIIAELQSQMQSVSLPLPETNTRQRYLHGSIQLGEGAKHSPPPPPSMSQTPLLYTMLTYFTEPCLENKLWFSSSFIQKF